MAGRAGRSRRHDVKLMSARLAQSLRSGARRLEALITEYAGAAVAFIAQRIAGWSFRIIVRQQKLAFENGRAINADFLNYKLITAAEMPIVESIIIEASRFDGPYGAKGAGEVALVVSAAAVANAIADAVGVRIMDYPITPEKILRALKQKAN